MYKLSGYECTLNDDRHKRESFVYYIYKLIK